MWRTFALLIFCLIFSKTTYGDSYSHKYIDDKVKRGELPEYCSYMGVDRKTRTPLGQLYRETYGPDWIHMHHYCWALADFQRGLDSQAIANLDYVLKASSIDFKLRPMVLYQKATILTVNKRYPEAASVYSEIIQISPEDENAYVALANLFLLQGNNRMARQVAEQGLKIMPNSDRLKIIAK